MGPVHVAQTGNEANKEDGAGSAPRFRSRRTVALLGYLATERRPIAREYLATLFWPDDPPAKGRSNLRRELYNLARVVPDCWQVDSQVVSFAPSAETRVDIDVLKRLESEKRWQEAADLLAGEYLEGLYLNDNLEFENWLLAEREHWRERSQAILHNICEELTRYGRYADALPYARRLLHLTPWEEENHRKVMRLLGWTDQREAALRQFHSCQQALADELGLEPSAEIDALYQQIQTGELAAPPMPPAFLAEGDENLHDVESFFVLREREMAWLNERLDNALSGRGGVAFMTGSPGRGKTTLMDAFAGQALAGDGRVIFVTGAPAGARRRCWKNSATLGIQKSLATT